MWRKVKKLSELLLKLLQYSKLKSSKSETTQDKRCMCICGRWREYQMKLQGPRQWKWEEQREGGGAVLVPEMHYQASVCMNFGLCLR